MKDEFIFALLFTGIGALFFSIGLLHRRPTLAQWDARTFQTIYHGLHRYRSIFRYIWPLGTTPVAVVLIAMTFIAGTPIGIVITLIFILAAALEPMVKMKLRRVRPYEVLTDVTMYQPRQPHDPSHPSGDALRVWFLAMMIPTAFGLSWPVYVLTGSIAATLSLGRLALGVHYPLDVLGGTGLGLLSAGFAVFSYHLTVIN